MATLAAAAVRQARALTRVSSPQSTATLVHRRGLAGAADHHGPPKINCWQDPMSPSKWKEEHFVIVSLSGWGLLIYGGYKFFTGGKEKKDEVGVVQRPYLNKIYSTGCTLQKLAEASQ